MSVYYYYVKRSAKETKRLMVSSSKIEIEKSRDIALDSGTEVTGIKKCSDPVGVIKLK